MTWERARSEEQIEVRVAQIVDATARLYEQHRFEDITFAMIAEEAAFTRSNLYRYFRTKEEIFLELLSRDMARWRAEFLQSFSKRVESASAAADIVADLLFKHDRMMRLLTILYTFLEPNASLEALTAFKHDVHETLSAIAAGLCHALSCESPQAAAELTVGLVSLAMGMYPLANLTANQVAAMDAVGMISTREHYCAVLRKSLAALLSGLPGDSCQVV